ncbi:putative clathrin assembly protein At5g57200 [Carica papaya]|uniref:putative clathrin assembly protein At5g57200 n=1 Tax=Carica papaya TaxID=3649 RepID=UPI000B8CDCB9|nr:putative clathrin assembly protein At5g57200 [Carica papaya]
MGTFQSFRKAYGALKDTTKVGLAKVNSEFKDLDIAIVKATNHVECPPKERHIRKIFFATSVARPRADVAYCIHALAKRLNKTRSWIVAIKTLIVIHRTLREGDPTFREELLGYSHRGRILQISNFKDDSSPLAWDCSAWVRTYALFLEERLECFGVLKYDIETERLTKSEAAISKAHSRTRILSSEELLEQLRALQQILYRLIGCHPEGTAYSNYLIQYALALVLKESFKIYCAINDGIISLVDMFFDMPRHDAVKALNIYKRAGQQAENLADFYEYCKGLELARNFQFPILRQPPPSFLATMEEYIKEAPQTGSVHNRLEYTEREEESSKPEEPVETEKQVENAKENEPLVETEEEPQPKEEEIETPPLISTEDVDLLGLNEINPKAAELEESNALALAIVPQGHDPSNPKNLALAEISGTGWELALVTTPSNNITSNLTQNELVRLWTGAASPNPFEQAHDPFHNVQQLRSPNQCADGIIGSATATAATDDDATSTTTTKHVNDTKPYLALPQYPQQSQYPEQQMSSINPFGDPFLSLPTNSSQSQQGNNMLL